VPQGSQFLEGEGGVHEVDVRLMNSQATVTLTPHYRNKQLHDTFLRQGKLSGAAFGSDVYDSFNRACDNLEHQLKRWTRAAPVKKDFRAKGPARM
jgi:hypothetical protein